MISPMTTFFHFDRVNLRNRPNQLQTHNLPTDDMENINSTNRGDLLLANKHRIVPCSTEMILQMIQRHSLVTFHRCIHPQ